MVMWASENKITPVKEEPSTPLPVANQVQILEKPRHEAIYTDAPGEFNFITLQNNLQNCLSIIDNEVMKNYVPALKNCTPVPLNDSELEGLADVEFFRITEMVYQEDEFSVHKLATVFNALSNKPCTLVLMIRSDGQTNNFYLGVRSNLSDTNSTATMRKMLEQSLKGLFPGSNTAEYYNEKLRQDLDDLNIGAISSVTCVADYKQDKDSNENKNFIQGLEKFIYSMQGKAFTAICIANNLEHQELVKAREEYERIYTLMSPFANMQYNYALNQSSSSSDSNTDSTAKSDSKGTAQGESTNENITEGEAHGSNENVTETEMTGENSSVAEGKVDTKGSTDGTNDSVTNTGTIGAFSGGNISKGISLFGIASMGKGKNFGITGSVSRGKTHGTSHTDSISNSVSETLTKGISSSKSLGKSTGTNDTISRNVSKGTGKQYTENENHTDTVSFAHTKALTDTFGNSQAVTLNVQNKSLINTLERLEKQMKRLDECESIGMWDFAAYFIGESAAEAETAASMYRSLVSGEQSGLEMAAVNTWTDGRVKDIAKYVVHFLHPVFLYDFAGSSMNRSSFVDATALASTNELAIELGLPRKSVKGLPVTEHALFAHEVLKTCREKNQSAKESVSGNNSCENEENELVGSEEVKKIPRTILLGKVNHFGEDTDTEVKLDLESLSMHTFITGSTGSGKSNTVYQILSELVKNGVRFLVVEPAKGEYKNVFGGRSNVAVYGTNPLVSDLLRINPFSFPKGVHIYEHLDRLVEIFNVCWPMYAAMPAVLKDAIERAYVKAGWNLRESRNKYNERLFPNFIDVLQEIDAVMEQSQYSSDNKSDYKGALCTRLRSLTNGINSLVFSADELSAEELFDKNVIVDLSRVGSTETKSLIMGLLVMKLQEHRIATCNGMNEPLRHVTVLEEAHNLLKRTSTEQTAEGSNLLGKSVEMLTNAIAEMRTYGEGFIIADQAPGLLDVSVIRNTNTKIIMRLPEYSDRELVGKAAGLKDEQIDELSKLSLGVAAVYQNDWVEAVLCSVKEYQEQEKYVFKEKDNSQKKDLKGEIVSRIISKDIYNLTDFNEDEIIKAEMPAGAKCRLYDYFAAPKSKSLDAVAALTYELFSAESAFASLSKNKFDFDQQRRFLIQNLTPSISPLPEQYSQIILYLVTYWNAHLTENSNTKILLDNLMKLEGEEGVIV